VPLPAVPPAAEATIFSELFHWPPILWTGRLLVLIVFAGTSAGAFLYFLRFFRWRSVAIMWNARLPKIKKFGGKLAGSEVGVELDQGQDQQVVALARRVDEMAVARTIDREAIEEIVRYLIEQEAQNDLFDPRALPGDTGGT
jgi:hypothetical protein